MLSPGRRIAGSERLAYALLRFAPALTVARSLLQVLNGATLAQDGRSGLGRGHDGHQQPTPVDGTSVSRRRRVLGVTTELA